ncbi:MAG: hypothetical protein LBQ63_05150 [Deltaproteobacteria bacterium]|jgi:hypothetical protein|nr:hypothetical protein [Deltaproteobacteria bacterium]
MKTIISAVNSLIFGVLLLAAFLLSFGAPRPEVDAEPSMPLRALAWLLRTFAEIVGAALGLLRDLLQWILG